ncbi:DNA-3-methyladenine glycosylase I [Sphingomonas sp. H39-1-10]|uniref:DNA-3-methyladenine glycosylase I n=1 Tax=Sphingomonas TaxID=13687 RepID=UPI0008885F7A|nr:MULTISPECIES: DNA-3-methyladenine glycosylase I [Sphingomonas]MDF0487626.1 DNA-3-methyladenine glycosylase I [Sphingomonas pollutisoli]SDA17078.1 DNA-3-methyladenine glycosylase I [Sphingomonas sp. NFR15]
MAGKTRCAWCGDDALMVRYHDEEWGVPLRDSRELWETLVLDGFQAGLSWRTILHKREAFRAAFAGFDPAIVARFDDADVARLMADPGIVRSAAKIRATIAAARIYLDMVARGEDFAAFVWDVAGGAPVEGDGHVLASTPASERMSRALKARGLKFVGPVIVHAWMQAVGMVNDHARACFRHAEVRALA